MIGPAVQTALIGEIEAELRCDLHLVAERFEGASDDGFAHVRAVHFSRVEERHTLAVCRTNDLNGVVDGNLNPVTSDTTNSSTVVRPGWAWATSVC